MIANIITLIIVIVLGVMAVKFLVGLIRMAVTSVLFILAAGIVVSILAGQDVISPAVGAVATALSNSSAP